MAQMDYIGARNFTPNAMTANVLTGFTNVGSVTARAYSRLMLQPVVISSVGRQRWEIAFDGVVKINSDSHFDGTDDITPIRSWDIDVPAGTQISIALAITGVSSSTSHSMHLFGFNDPATVVTGVTSIEALNMDTATTAPSAATLLVGNATANVDGAYIEIVASTSADIVGLTLIPRGDDQTYTGNYSVTVGVGAASSEVSIVPAIRCRRRSGTVTNMDPVFVPVAIPSGSRIAAFVNASTNTAGAKDLGVLFLAHYGTLSSGGNVIIQGAPMQRAIKDAETTASRKRLFFDIRDSDGAAWAGSVTGVKAQLSTSGAAEAASTNDIVRVGGVVHYVELTNAEAAAGAAGDIISARVAADTGRLASTVAYAEITADDVYAAGLTAADIVSAEIAALDGLTTNATNLTINGVSNTITRVARDPIATITAD